MSLLDDKSRPPEDPNLDKGTVLLANESIPDIFGKRKSNDRRGKMSESLFAELSRTPSLNPAESFTIAADGKEAVFMRNESSWDAP